MAKRSLEEMKAALKDDLKSITASKKAAPRKEQGLDVLAVSMRTSLEELKRGSSASSSRMSNRTSGEGN